MDITTRRYVAVIIKEPDTAYLGTVPDFGACFTLGDTIEEVKANLPDMVATHLQGIEEDGRTLPEPRSRTEVLGMIDEPVVEDYVIELELDAPSLLPGPAFARPPKGS